MQIEFCPDCLTPKQEHQNKCINCNLNFDTNTAVKMTESQYLGSSRKPCKNCHRPIIEGVKKCYACKTNQ